MRILKTAAAAVMICGAFAAPAAAQNSQEGLVNVAIDDTTIQAPIAIAANICDVGVGVLAQQEDAAAACTATADSAASQGRGGGSSTRQEGLVNVLVDDLVLQVPIALAANICDINISVLAEITDDAAACDADATATADRAIGAGAPGAGGGGAGASAVAFDPIQLVLDGTLNLLTDSGLTPLTDALQL